MEETQEQEFDTQEYLDEQLDYLEWDFAIYEGF